MYLSFYFLHIYFSCQFEYVYILKNIFLSSCSFDEKVACRKILEKKGIKGFQIGRTKVFLRAGQMAELDARRTEVLSSAAQTIQRRIRTHIAHQQFIEIRKASIVVQSFSRGEPQEYLSLNL